MRQVAGQCRRRLLSALLPLSHCNPSENTLLSTEQPTSPPPQKKTPVFCNFAPICYALAMNMFKRISLKLGIWASLVVASLFILPINIANAGPNCTCRANGQDYNEGQIICIRLPSGAQLSRCERVLNNTSWKKMGDGCPSASLSQPAINLSKWVKRNENKSG